MRIPWCFFATWALLVFALATFDSLKLARIVYRVADRLEVPLCQ